MGKNEGASDFNAGKVLLAKLLHISVVPGNELEGLVTEKDGQGELEDNHPLIE